MKRIRLFSLLTALLLLLTSCGSAQPETKTAEFQEENAVTAATEESESTAVTEEITTEGPPPVYDEKVETLLPPLFEKLPIANASMTEDELRQLCVDYVCLSVSFQWVPAKHFTYVTSSKDVEVNFYEGKLYGGIPYINLASGNLYRIMEFYDPETGVMDLTKIGGNGLIGTACSGTAGWGWQRVINSADLSWTSHLNVYGGMLRVGPYTYKDSIKIFGVDGAPECKSIAKKNGQQTMYESYALLEKGDCVVNNGHVRMVKEVNVVRGENGFIDFKNSYVIQCEQGLYNTSATHDRTTQSGTAYKIQGNDNLKSTFEELYFGGYLPHTFKEFHGLDPVEPGEASIGLTGTSASRTDLEKCVAKANYAISDIFTAVYDPEGKEVLRYAKRMTTHFTYQCKMSQAIPSNALQKYQDQGGYTVELTCQIGNGEIITLFKGELKG
ncbi:MAG: hypothetical protein IKC69_05485 [Clostridia bacterium]|nr:hypothetical protein [Clostridia bacterium]